MRNGPQHDLPGPRKDLHGGPDRPPSRASMKRFHDYLLREIADRRQRRPGEEDEPAPVRPDKPLDLSGGAAASMEDG